MLKNVRRIIAFLLMGIAALLMFLTFVDPVGVGAIRVFALVCYAIGFVILPKQSKDTSLEDNTVDALPEANRSLKSAEVEKLKKSEKTLSQRASIEAGDNTGSIEKEPSVKYIVPQIEVPAKEEKTVERGNITFQKLKVTDSIKKQLKERFIAVDVETTGLSSKTARIIELGAVLFENGKEVNSFSSLVNPGVHIPKSASAVNHITDSMISDAPRESEIYPEFVSFLSDSLDGETLLCAHNASFDMGFICEELMNLGYDGSIKCVDTLWLARNTIKGLPNYKQDTVANYYDLVNKEAHRALSDARICGNILLNLLKEQSTVYEQNRAASKADLDLITPSAEELEVCAVIQDCLQKNNCDTSILRFRKDSSGYVASKCLYTFNRFKFAKKGKYIIIAAEAADNISLPKRPCSVTEGGTKRVRVLFSNPMDLYQFENEFVREYKIADKNMHEYIDHDSKARKDASNYINSLYYMSRSEMQEFLKEVSSKEYESILETKPSVPIINREDIVIHPKHSRCPLNEIRNLGDFDKGFDEGYPYWEKGEKLRASGDLESAIKNYDLARFNGYDAPALYTSYAMAYHKLKDYENEIAILDEFLERNEYVEPGRFEARRNKAIELLVKYRENEKRKEAAEERKRNKAVAKKEPINRGRAILQLDDSGNIIMEYDSVAKASSTIGISSKSLRDAAKGVQKHAGGYVWRYKDEYDINPDS